MFGRSQGSGGSGFSFGANNNAGAGSTMGSSTGTTAAPAFGQQGSTFGANTGGQQNSAFGSAATPNSLFGSNTNNTANTSFGSKPAGSGLFGAASNTSSTPAFGQAQNNTGSGCLFGAKPAAPAGGLFCSSDTASTGTTGTTGTTANSGGLFGNNSNTNTQSGGLFGNSNNNNNANTTNTNSGGLFGNNASTNTNTSTTGTGLFGNTASTTTNTNSGGLFGNSASGNTNTGTTGGLFGNSGTTSTATTGTTGGLFGNNASTGTSTTGTTGGLFGNSGTTGSSTTGTTGGLFGNSGTTGTATTGTTGGLFGNNASTSTGTTGGLFGNSGTGSTASTTGGLFGNSGASGSTTGTTGGLFGNNASTGTGTTGGLFGSSTGTAQIGSTNGLFSNNTAANTGTLVGTAQPMFASISRAAYELPNVAPSVKLYTSLTARPADQKQNTHKQEKKVAPPPALLPKKRSLEPEPPKPEARKLMNSYKRFLEERPTNLQIKRSKTLLNSAKTLALPKPPQEDPKKELEFSIFHKTDKDVNTLTINKRALEQGYFSRPSLEELIVYTKPQLKAVKGLIIGRTGYGQIEYPQEVDLSTITNLGDILGTLVQFNEGTVSVYPDEDKKAKEGTELNRPAVVTIENVAPRDPSGLAITDNSDPRVGKFADELKRRCTAKDAEFITLTRGIWVFKVPHFSVWGITPQEMIMEDDTPEKILDESMEVIEVDNVQPESGSGSGSGSGTRSSLSSPEFVSAIEPEIKDQMLPLTLLPARQDAVVGMEIEQVDIEQPTTWAGLMKDNVLLGASDSAVPNTTSASAARNAIFAGVEAPTPTAKVTQTPAPSVQPKFTDSDLLMPLEDLKARTTATPRVSGPAKGLAKLSTKIAFSDLERIESANPAWSIAAMLFEPSQEVKESLSAWIKRSTGNTPSSLGGIDLVWYLITVHSLEEAAARATALGNIRLASMIACLADRRSQNRENAQHLLTSLASNGSIYEISEVERRILEVAAGNLTVSPAKSDGKRSIPQLEILQGLNWRQRIGMYLWYGNYSKSTTVGDLVQKAVKDAPEDNTELAMLKLVGDSNNLSALLSLVDEPTAFLLLQVLQSGAQMNAGSRQQLADQLYTTFSQALSAEGRVSWALFVGLHIEDDAKALELTRRLLNQYPTYHFDETYLPAHLVNEVAAQYASDQGDYQAAAQKWLRAGQSERAHSVLVEHVAPAAVIAEDLGSVVPLLDQVDPSVPGWDRAGKVYCDFYKYQRSPSAGLAQSLSQSLGRVEAGTLAIRAAVSVMAEYLATHARASLTTQEIMGMPLGADSVSVHACLCAFNDLEKL